MFEIGASIAEHYDILIVDLLLTMLLAYPLINFLHIGIKRKEYEITSSLSTRAKEKYLQTFQQKYKTDGEVEENFGRCYRKLHGRCRFFWPIILILAIASTENYYLGRDIIAFVSPVPPQFSTTSAAIAGAYIFVTLELIDRAQARSLCVAHVMRGALRLAAAIPVGYAFAALCTECAPFLAFAVGVFPLQIVSTALRQISNKKLGTELGAADSRSQVTKLCGVDAAVAEKMQDADITTIAQLAWCDPMQLTMRTNLNFDYVVDLCSQALAWVYFGDKLDTLRSFGLRGAVEIIPLHKDLKNNTAKQKAELLIKAAAEAVSMNVDGLKNAIEQIAEDPYAEFLWNAAWLSYEERVNRHS